VSQYHHIGLTSYLSLTRDGREIIDMRVGDVNKLTYLFEKYIINEFSNFILLSKEVDIIFESIENNLILGLIKNKV